MAQLYIVHKYLYFHQFSFTAIRQGTRCNRFWEKVKKLHHFCVYVEFAQKIKKKNLRATKMMINIQRNQQR